MAYMYVFLCSSWNVLLQISGVQEGMVTEDLFSSTNQDWIALPQLLSLISSATSSDPLSPSLSEDGTVCDQDDQCAVPPARSTPPLDHTDSHFGSLYYYFSDGIGALREAGQECLPLDDFSSSGNIADCDVNVWLGQKGVTAHAHYDGYDNFFTQLSGRKLVRLAAPAATPILHPYPYIHPFARQAQTDCLAPPAGKVGSPIVGAEEPLRAAAKPPAHQRTKEGRPDSTTQPELEIWETILEEGEVLFIPAYWWHRITALDNAISLNAW